MNTYVSSEQPGFTPDPKNNDNSVNYLRRLKAQVDEEIILKPVAAISGAAAPPKREQRRSPRFRCSGSVALTADNTQVRMWGTLTDISLRGCYVEMSSTLPVDTKVDLVLDASGIRIRAKAMVRISYPGLGMGILITELAPEQREFLDQLLAILAQAAPLPVRSWSWRGPLRTPSPRSIPCPSSTNYGASSRPKQVFPATNSSGLPIAASALELARPARLLP